MRGGSDRRVEIRLSLRQEFGCRCGMRAAGNPILRLKCQDPESGVRPHIRARRPWFSKGFVSRPALPKERPEGESGPQPTFSLALNMFSLFGPVNVIYSSGVLITFFWRNHLFAFQDSQRRPAGQAWAPWFPLQRGSARTGELGKYFVLASSGRINLHDHQESSHLSVQRPRCD